MSNSKPGKIPTYRLHKPSGRGVVTIGGRDFYLPGKHNSAESRAGFARLIGELKAGAMPVAVDLDCLTIVELIAKYIEFARGYYRSAIITHQDGSKTGGQQTKEFSDVCRALRPLRVDYGRSLVAEFGPRAFIAVRQKFIDDGLCRASVNGHAGRVRRMFRWGVEMQLVSPAVLTGLEAVRDLKPGRCDAPETEPVRPVSAEVFERTLEFLPPTLADALRIQFLTGARSGEICVMRRCDIDTTGRIWIFRPYTHKNAYRRHDRLIFLGPEAQAIIQKYFTPNLMAHLFRPCDSESQRLAENHAKRKTPMNQGNRPGKGKRTRRRPPGEQYTPQAIGRAVRRACERAFPVPEGLSEVEARRWRKANWWHPHTVRHAAAERFRKQSGLVVTGILLGHKSLVTTERYASPDVAAASELIAKIG